MVGEGTGEAGANGRGTARASADHVRPRDDQGHGLLPRYRELFAALYRPLAGRASADAARLFSARLRDVPRRVPSNRAPAAWHVSRRPVAEVYAGGIWLPLALRIG